MWMMGCSDSGEFNIPAADSFNGRKPRPLIPRTPMPCSNNSPPAATLGRLHGNDFFSLNHHLANMGEQGKRDLHTQQVVVSSRWNPTPEQLRTLEELYRRGTRTPSTEQIQHITAQLRKYGKIEGKNVFYWFQNHKARERQKRRREMESAVPDHQHQLNPQQHQHPPDIEIFERKESGANRTTGYEGEQIKNWAASTNCSTLAEESISRQRAAKGAMGECREADGWFELEEVEFQHRRNFMERNGTWQMMQLCCPSPTTHIINATSTNCNTSTTTSTLAEAATATTISTPTAASAPTRRTMDPKLIKTRAHDLNIFIAPYYNTENWHLFNEEDNGCGESQTLQLFPLRSCGSDANESINDKETETSSAAMNANFTPYQFFEFLPLKN